MTEMLRRLANQRRSRGFGRSVTMMILDDFSYYTFPPFRAKLWFRQSDQ